MSHSNGHKQRKSYRPILRPPNYDLFSLAVDALQTCLGAVLFQLWTTWNIRSATWAASCAIVSVTTVPWRRKLSLWWRLWEHSVHTSAPLRLLCSQITLLFATSKSWGTIMPNWWGGVWRCNNISWMSNTDLESWICFQTCWAYPLLHKHYGRSWWTLLMQCIQWVIYVRKGLLPGMFRNSLVLLSMSHTPRLQLCR